MNGHVHYGLTRRWAIDEGFSEEDAERIARADIGVDGEFPGRRMRFKRYHFRWLGARRIARSWMEDAIEHGDPELLGKALHCEQDAISHGHLGHVVHWPGIDEWDKRGDRVRARLEAATRDLLREYRSRTAVDPALSRPRDAL